MIINLCNGMVSEADKIAFLQISVWLTSLAVICTFQLAYSFCPPHLPLHATMMLGLSFLFNYHASPDPPFLGGGGGAGAALDLLERCWINKDLCMTRNPACKGMLRCCCSGRDALGRDLPWSCPKQGAERVQKGQFHWNRSQR